MSHHTPRQLSPSPVATGPTPEASPPPPPSASEDGIAPPQTSNDPTMSDSQTSNPSPSTSAQSQISLSPSITPSLTSSDPTVAVPSSTSTSSPFSSTSLPPTTFSSMTLSLPPTSSSSLPGFVESTTSKSSSSSASTTSFTTIITTLSDGSVFSTVSPLPTSLQTKSTNPSNSPNRVGIIAGTTTAVGCFILLLLSLIFCYRKKKLGKLWDTLDLRGGRARERRGLLEDEDFEDALTHVRARSDISVSGPRSFTSRGGSVNLSLGSAAGNSPVLSHASPRFISPAIPLATVPDPSTSYSPIRSSFPPTTIISTPSFVNPSLQSSQSPQNRAQTPNSYSSQNYMNYNSSVSSFPPSPPVPTLFRPRASESGSIFREEGVWPPPNEKSNEFVDPFIGHVKKVSGDVGDELGKVVSDVMGPSGMGHSGSGSISSPTPSQQPFYSSSPSTMTMLPPSPQSLMLPKASLLSAPIMPVTTAAAGGTGGTAHFMGTTGLDDRSTGTKKERQNRGDSPTWKSTNRHNILTPSPSSSPEPSISPLPAPPAAMANAHPKGTSMGLSPHDTTFFSHYHRNPSLSSLSLPPGAAPAAIPGLTPVIPTSSTSALRMSPATYTVSPTTSQKSPISAGTTNTVNTLSSMTKSDASSVLYKYRDGEMPGVEEDFGWRGGGDAMSNNTRRKSGDSFEFVRGEKVDREVVSQELGILKENARMVGGGNSFSPPSARRNPRSMSTPLSTTPTASTQTTTGISPSSSSSLTLSPTSSPTLKTPQVKKPSPLKQQTLAD